MGADDERTRYDRLLRLAGWAAIIGWFCAVLGLFAVLGELTPEPRRGNVVAGLISLIGGILIVLAAAAIQHPLIDIARAARAVQREIERRQQEPPRPPTK